MTTTNKKVYIQLHELQFASDKGDYYGIIKSNGEVDNSIVAQRIIDEGSEYQLESVTDILNKGDRIRKAALSSGESVKTSWANARLTCEGVFKDATFDSNVQDLHVSLSAPTAMQESLKGLKAEVIGLASAAPEPLNATDMKTGSVNLLVTPNNVMKVEGTHQKIYGSDPKVGIWFTSIADGSQVLVEQLLTNEPKTLMFMIPDLPQGSYSLSLATQFSKGSNETKIVKTGSLPSVLTVGEETPVE